MTCEVEDCKNEDAIKVCYERRHEAVDIARVCTAHYTLDRILKEKLGRFASVITVDSPRRKLKNQGVGL